MIHAKNHQVRIDGYPSEICAEISLVLSLFRSISAAHLGSTEAADALIDVCVANSRMSDEELDNKIENYRSHVTDDLIREAFGEDAKEATYVKEEDESEGKSPEVH